MKTFIFTLLCWCVCLFTTNAQLLYGTTSAGGKFNGGTLFSYDAATNTYNKLKNFGQGSDGRTPYGGLCKASNGKLYGMTIAGGSNNYGIIFSYNPSTSNYSKLFEFGGTNGANPYGSLIQASDGKLYGLTNNGGAKGSGVIFSIDPATGVFTKLYDFDGYSGKNPTGSLMQASNGKLYGMTTFGGENGGFCCGEEGYGVIFSFEITTSTYAKIHDFGGEGGAWPHGGLMQAANGLLYGVTGSGGIGSVPEDVDTYGVLFSIDPDTYAFTNLHNFDRGKPRSNGATPVGTLIQAADGNLYGLTANGGGSEDLGVIFSYNIALPAYTPQFKFSSTDGTNPLGSLMQASDGKLYGMTSNGGSKDSGVIFSFTPGEATPYQKLVDFASDSGAFPAYTFLIEYSCTPRTYYRDADGDGYGNPTDTIVGCTIPQGYGVKSGDCDDANKNINPGATEICNNGIDDNCNGLMDEDCTPIAQLLYGTTSSGGKYNGGTINTLEPVTPTSGIAKNFDIPSIRPQGGLVLASNGKFYGVNGSGGTYGYGTIFSYDKATGIYTQLADLIDSSGARPNGSLAQASNGKLYGLTQYGGVNHYGVIFSFDPTTNIYTKVFDFGEDNGLLPYGSLIQATNGKLYGMTYGGGSNGYGVIFSFDPVTNTYTKLYDFDGENGDRPVGSLMQASNDRLYGLTSDGGSSGGVIFSFNLTTSAYTKLHDFDGTNGSKPYGTLTQASDGKLYGTTTLGGANGYGVIFSFDPATAIFKKQYDFTFNSQYYDFTDSKLTQAADGKLYGTISNRDPGDEFIFSFDPATATYNQVFDFSYTDSAGYIYGTHPQNRFVLAPDGKLYGLAEEGGKLNGGVMYAYNPATETYSKLKDFGGNEDGTHPYGSLYKASDGKFYGTTRDGGTNNVGVLFSYNPATHTFKKLLDFDRNNGAKPYENKLVQAADGKLYGLTKEGGSDAKGVLFSYNPATAVYTKLVDFTGTDNGASPNGGLTQALNGKLYGTTHDGGMYNNGVIFSFDPVTNTLAKLSDFNSTRKNGTNAGEYPFGSLVQATDGKLYGAADGGGTSGNSKGVIFCYNPSNATYTKVHDFTGADGAEPNGEFIQALDGNLYGTTHKGGVYNNGTIFSYNPSTSTYTLLYSFDYTNGAYPYNGVIQASDEKLYGMTSSGGTLGRGIAYAYAPGASTPFHKLIDFTSSNGAIPYSSFTEDSCVGCSPVTINITNASVTEGNSGTKDMNFYVTLSAPSSQSVIVNYRTIDNTATASSDYAARTGTLTFIPGLRKRIITIKIKGDVVNEPKETFRVVLSKPVNATIGDGSGRGTILDNDDNAFIASTDNKVQGMATAGNRTLTATPNPASSTVNVLLNGYSGNVLLQITSLEGKLLKAVKLQGTARGQINISDLANGTYFLTATEEHGYRQTVKVVVVH